MPDPEIVIASEGTPATVDIEAVAEQLRQEQVSGAVQASTEVHGDVANGDQFYTH
jgi:hypothetical protein